jgi:hypothetical protein
LQLADMTPGPASLAAVADEPRQSRHVESVEQDQSVMGIVMAVGGGGEQDVGGQADSE